MSREDATDGPTAESSDDQRRLPGTDALPGADDLPAAVPDAAQPSGLTAPLAGIGGGVLLLRGIRQFRRGARLRGVAQAVVGGALVGLAAGGRLTGRIRGRDVEQTDVVDTAPDLEDAVDSTDEGPDEHETGDEAAAVTGSTDVEDAVDPGDTEDSDHATGEDAAAVAGSSVDVEDAAEEDAREGDETAETDTEDAASGDDTDEESPDGTAVDADTGEETEAEADTDEESEAGEGVADDSFDAGQQELSPSDAEGESDTDEEAETDDAADGEAATDETDGESDTGSETAEQSYDRLGAAAFDDDSGRLPAPQRAFNQGYLSADAEAQWGIREGDGAVLVTHLWDSIEDREELRYVASTDVGDERMVTVPSEILDHWNDFGEGIAVESGTDLVFATDDDLKADDLLLVVPELWADEALDVED